MIFNVNFLVIFLVIKVLKLAIMLVKPMLRNTELT